MIEHICEFMNKWHMVSAGKPCDCWSLWWSRFHLSMPDFKKELSTRMNFSLEVIHVEHGIRGKASKEDALFVKQFCQEQTLTYREFPVNVPAYANKHYMGDEEAARKLRYEIFAEVAKEKRKVRKLHWHIIWRIMRRRCFFSWREAAGLMVCAGCGRYVRARKGMLYPPFVGNQQGRD